MRRELILFLAHVYSDSSAETLILMKMKEIGTRKLLVWTQKKMACSRCGKKTMVQVVRSISLKKKEKNLLEARFWIPKENKSRKKNKK